MACARCGAELAADALACPACHALRHGARLDELSARAKAAESSGQFVDARAAWSEMLPLLPDNSRQALWVASRVVALKDIEDLPPSDEARKTAGARSSSRWAWLGPLIPLLLLLFKGKGLIALLNAKTLISLFAFVGFYGSQLGWAFGAGFALLILIHELGHYFDIQRRGLPADMPVFLPGLGAYVRWRALGVSDVTRAEVSLAGPLAGAVAAWGCAAVWLVTDAPIRAALARSGAWLNILNLVPLWVLDGGQAARVLDRSARLAVGSLALALWVVFAEPVFGLVAAGAFWRAFQRDVSASPSAGIAWYFGALLISLGLSMWLMPGVSAGLPE